MAEFSVSNVERRAIPGYGGKYEVGRDGSVWRSGTRLVVVLGYVTLSHGSERSQVRVAYLVARAFVPNLEGRPWLRHKNGNTRDDRAENLEWSEQKEETRGRKRDRSAVVVWRKGSEDLVGSWPDLRSACLDLGVDENIARRVLRGGQRSTGGYIFRYA